MDKIQVRHIIEATLKSGNRTPGLFDLPKVLGLKNRLEACDSLPEVINLLEAHRGLVCKSFGLSDALFHAGLEKLRELQ